MCVYITERLRIKNLRMDMYFKREKFGSSDIVNSIYIIYLHYFDTF